jgi:hypothetical protein
VALRVAGVPWRREWFVATLGGLVFASTLVNLLWSRVALVVVPLPPMLILVISEAVVALLQWVVLRAHVRRPSLWFGAAAATILSTFTLRWLMTGFVMPRALPDQVWARLAIPATAALIQGVCFVWLLSSRRDAEGSLRSNPAWFVVEWTTAAGVAMLLILGAASVMGAVMGRPGGPAVPYQFVLLPALAGLVIGALQWAVLRHRLPLGPGWIGASVAAMGLPAVGILVPELMAFVAHVWFLTLLTPGAFAILGAWMGIVQWLLLRRHVTAALLWVPTTALAWSAWHLRFSGVSSLTIGVLAGVVTGIVMAVLLRHTKPAPVPPPHAQLVLES